MIEESLFVFIILVLILEQIVETYLSIINLKHAEKFEVSILPVQLANLYSKEEQDKSLKYTRAKTYFGIFSNYYGLAILLVLLISGSFQDFDIWLGQFGFAKNTHGTAYLISIVLFFSLTQLPISYYSAFVLEEKFGFNKTTRFLWVKDLLIGLVLNILIMAPVIYLLLYLMANLSVYWWIYASLAIVSVQSFLAFIFPVWIAPLFNKFSDLQDPELRDAIIKLVEKIGYRTTGVFSVDGSKRSRHANAYFAGLGKSKRIVLYDTLIELLKKNEILAVLAHEIGHEKLGHIKKSLLLSTLFIFCGFFILNYFYNMQEFYSALGFENKSNHAALLIFSLITGPLMYFINPLFNSISRKYEYQADNFAVKATGSYEPLANALASLSKNSLSNLNPHPWYSFMHYSHPTLPERIKAMSKAT